jgi:outer membrane murein-binding lipoprotein Lpp
MRYTLFILAALLLAGCASTTYGVSCPPLLEYDLATQAQVSKELDTAGPAVRRMIDDYGATRDAIRACEKRRAKP